MQIPQIRMESTFAQIGLNINKAEQRIEQPQAELNLSQKPAELTIEQARTELQIDSSQARANIGIMTPMQFSDSNAAYGKQQWLQAVGEMSQEGDQLMRIHTKANAIADIGKARGMRVFEGGYTPPATSNDEGVDINIRVKPVEINVEQHGMSMNPVVKPPVLSYTPGKVEPYVKQYASLKIDVVGSQLDRTM